MSITSLASIRRSQYVNWIRVCIGRAWRPKKFQSDCFDGMHYVLIDEKGDAIHAIVDEHDYIHTPKMKIGCMYDIYHVHVKSVGSGYKVVDRDIEIGFNEMSTIIPLEPDACPIPKFAYQFVLFNEVEDCYNKQQISEKEKKRILLADIYGCIKEVVPPHTIFIAARNDHESICEVVLENHRRETLKITLWSDIARNFDMKSVEDLDTPTFAVFTSLRMKKYKGEITPTATNHTCVIFNPSLPQFASYNSEFNKPGDVVRVSRFYSGQNKDNTWKSIMQLRTLDPNEYKDRIVLCCARILRFPNHSGWWYNSCSVQRCFKQMKPKVDNESFACSVHGDQLSIPAYRVFMTVQDDKDQITLTLIGRQAENLFGYTCSDLLNKREYSSFSDFPDEILTKIGETYLFELKIGYNNEFVVKNIHSDPSEVEEDENHSSHIGGSGESSNKVAKDSDSGVGNLKIPQKRRIRLPKESSGPSPNIDKKQKKWEKNGLTTFDETHTVDKEKKD